MKVRLTKRNVSDTEMATALAGIVTEEGIVHEVHELLGRLIKADRNKDGEELIPERYMRYIGDQLLNDFRALLMSLIENVDTWIDYQSQARRSILKSFRKSADVPPVLSQEQIDELKRLIEYTFRSAIGLGYTANEDTLKHWKKIGIKDSNIHIDAWIRHAYVAGRLADLLTNTTSFEDMMQLAKKLPMSRADKLVLEMSKQNSARFITGYAEKLGGLATDVALDQHKKSISAIIQSYFSGDLKREIDPESGFSPNEESVIRDVTSWRQLASELRNRFKQTDLLRDWERVAFTEMRFATNLGRVMNIQHEGGGDPEVIEVFFHVLPTACASCRKLYLNPDGKPKIFKLSEIIDNIADTGGLNVGRKASTIGQADGWVPNAVAHPNCHCYPIRKIGGLEYAEFQ